MKKIEYGDDGTQRFYDEDRLVGLIGKNSQDKYGYFFDKENGLCMHEAVTEYCSDCQTDGLNFLEELFVD